MTANATPIAIGRNLVHSTGYMNCHTLKLDRRFSAPADADLANGELANTPAVAKSAIAGAEKWFSSLSVWQFGQPVD